MIGYVNECRGCEVCYHCGADRTKTTICDECGTPAKVIDFDNRELCAGCVTSICDAWFDDLTLTDKLMIFNFDLDEYQTIEGAEADANNYWDSLELTDKIIFYNEVN